MIKPHETWSVIDSTKIQTALDCERKFFYNYILGWQSTAPNNHLVFGSAWHVAMEHMLLHGYEAHHVKDAYNKFLEEYRKDFDKDTDDQFAPKDPDNALSALVGYAVEHEDDHEKYEVLFTETSGTVLLTEDDIIYFKTDSILRERKGERRYLSMEHKTGSRTGRVWEDQWLLKTQVGTYNHVLNCM